MPLSKLKVADSEALRKVLRPTATKYIWWKTADESLEWPERLIGQMMHLEIPEDMKRLVDVIGEQGLRDVIGLAQAGWFNERSWRSWHYRLGLAELGKVPPLPVRTFK